MPTPVVLLAVLLAGLVACLPGPDALREHPPVIEARGSWSVRIDAVMPTDVMPTQDGGFAVLDGYSGRVLTYDAERAFVGPLTGNGLSRPVRMASDPRGGTWVVEAAASEIVRVDDRGRALDRIAIPKVDDFVAEPVAALATREEIAVSDRLGTLRWFDRSGAVVATAAGDVDGIPFGVLTDLVALEDGGLLAVDALESRVHHFGPDRAPLDWFGRYGEWVGYLSKPVAAAPGPDGTVLVVDSRLRAVQLFERDGHPLGVLATDGEPIRPVHPVAIEATGDGGYLLLDAGSGRDDAAVIGFRLDADAIPLARVEASTRWLRVPLIRTGEHDPARNCVQCHSGLINDSREVWDPSLGHHPVDVIPDRKLPAFFPLGEDGRLQCVTCHSPHGESTLEEVASIQDPEQRATLVRHAPKAGVFTRLSRDDSALCVACHEKAAHEQALARLGLVGKAHPVGEDLDAALAGRPTEDGSERVRGGCLGCHATHGADEKGLAREAGSGSVCGTCHESQARPERNHPVGGRPVAASQRPDDIPTGRDGTPTCRSCHDLAGGRGESLVRVVGGGRALCTTCHTDRAPAMRRAHGRVAEGGADQACMACHDVHDGNVATNLLSTVQQATLADPKGCLTCHGPTGSARKSSANPGVAGHPVDGKSHEGHEGTLTCGSCHDSHDPAALPVDCGSCHADKAEDARRGGHGTATCLDCHPAHREAPLAAVADVNPASRRCLACHGESTGRGDASRVSDYEHPAPVFTPGGARWEPLGALPLFGPAGQALPAGVNGDLTCSTCHVTHGPDAAHPGDSIRRAGWQPVCAACHGDDALPLYRYFHQLERRSAAGSNPQ